MCNRKSTAKKPKIAIICGSGLGGMTDLVKDAVEIQYDDIPGFPVSSVKGHSGKLVIGEMCGVTVAMYKGRVHLYEGIDPKKTRVLIYTLKLLGCEQLILSSAVGSCDKAFGPGSVVLVKDHINNQGLNPLYGPNDPIGPRFTGMKQAYDSGLRNSFKEAAKQLNIELGEGIYHAALGPAFETPAEVQAYKNLGANLLGMSVVGETLCARHCGLRVAALAVVVNYACSAAEIEPSHAETLEQASKATPRCIALVEQYLKNFELGQQHG